MSTYQVVAIAQAVADEVRRTLRAPVYGHPAHVEVAPATGPCRLCLEPFAVGAERRVLFTYNPFPEPATPAPGPVFVHAESCVRHAAAGFPSGLKGFRLLLEGYDATGMAVRRVAVGDAAADAAAMVADPGVSYAHLRNAVAGCFIARVERA